MIHPRTTRLIEPFRAAAAAYRSAPGVLNGLDLAEITSQLKQAAASELRDDALVELLHRCLQAVHAGDAFQAESLITTIGARLEQLTPQSRSR